MQYATHRSAGYTRGMEEGRCLKGCACGAESCTKARNDFAANKDIRKIRSTTRAGNIFVLIAGGLSVRVRQNPKVAGCRR